MGGRGVPVVGLGETKTNEWTRSREGWGSEREELSTFLGRGEGAERGRGWRPREREKGPQRDRTQAQGKKGEGEAQEGLGSRCCGGWRGGRKLKGFLTAGLLVLNSRQGFLQRFEAQEKCRFEERLEGHLPWRD